MEILHEDNYEFSFKITLKSLWVIRVNERRSEVKHESRRTVENREQKVLSPMQSIDSYVRSLKFCDLMSEFQNYIDRWLAYDEDKRLNFYLAIVNRKILISSKERAKTLDRRGRRQIRLRLFALVWMVVTCVETVHWDPPTPCPACPPGSVRNSAVP